jgi:glycosyltransferase involved in cell wall biosynthesis
VVGVSRFALPTRTYPSIAHRSSVIRSPFEHPPRFDAPAAAAALRQELGVGPETRILAYAGIFVDRKRPVLFVDIVKTLLDRHPAMPVMGVLFGEVTPDTADVHRQVLERARSLGIADRIRPMGFRRPLYPWLAATDILVVPAVNEPFGRTLIEAMMLGTPVVAARSGGNIEAIVDGENGFLVAPDDPTAFVLPLARLISEPALYGRIAATAKKRALGTFSDETHVREIVALYKDILQARAGARPSGHNNRMTAT